MPHRAANRRQWVRALGYIMFMGAGAVSLLHPPVSYQESAAWVPVAWGVLMFAPAAVAALGCVLPRYRWEWIATWLLAAGAGLYAVAGWGQVADSGLGHATRAFAMTGVAILFVARALQLARDSESARLALEARGAVGDEDV